MEPTPETTPRPMILLVGGTTPSDRATLRQAADGLAAEAVDIETWRAGDAAPLEPLVRRATAVGVSHATPEAIQGMLAAWRQARGQSEPVTLWPAKRRPGPHAFASLGNAVAPGDAVSVAHGPEALLRAGGLQLGPSGPPVSLANALQRLPRPTLVSWANGLDDLLLAHQAHAIQFNRRGEIAGFDGQRMNASTHDTFLLDVICQIPDAALGSLTARDQQPLWREHGRPIGPGLVAAAALRGGVLRAMMPGALRAQGDALIAHLDATRADRRTRLLWLRAGRGAESVASGDFAATVSGSEDLGLLLAGDPGLSDPLDGPLADESMARASFWLSAMQHHPLPMAISQVADRVGGGAWRTSARERMLCSVVRAHPAESLADALLWDTLLRRRLPLLLRRAVLSGMLRWMTTPEPLGAVLVAHLEQLEAERCFVPPHKWWRLQQGLPAGALRDLVREQLARRCRGE